MFVMPESLRGLAADVNYLFTRKRESGVIMMAASKINLAGSLKFWQISDTLYTRKDFQLYFI